MKIYYLPLFYLVLISTSCQSNEECQPPITKWACAAASFVGEWELVGNTDDYPDDACLYGDDIVPMGSTSITLDPEDSLKILYRNISLSLVRQEDGCVGSTRGSTLLGFLLSDGEIKLVHSNRLETFDRLLFTASKKTYRRKL